MNTMHFQLQVLKDHLESKGHTPNDVDTLVQRAKQEIEDAIARKQEKGMDNLIDVGIHKGSPDFINDLRPSDSDFTLETESGRTDFSLPPYPNLRNILKNPKVAKDGTLYKVIPVGAKSTPRNIASNIFDAQRSMDVERKEHAQRISKTPTSTKTIFRTASSKQDPNTNWVLPKKEMDFTDDLNQVNSELREAVETIVSGVIQSYKESY